MAKGRAGVIGTGAFRLPVRSHNDLPWEEIEAAAGVSLSEENRREIFGAYVAYHARLSVEADRAPAAEVEALRETIVSSARSLIDVLEHFRGVSGGALTDGDEALYSALAFATTASGFDLTATLRAVEPACRELLRGLGDGAVDLAVTMTRPEVAALAGFFCKALDGATPSRARASPGYNAEPSVWEHSRWGVPLGPKAARTAAFASAVLQRDVSAAQVEHAFALAMVEHRAGSRR